MKNLEKYKWNYQNLNILIFNVFIVFNIFNGNHIMGIANYYIFPLLILINTFILKVSYINDMMKFGILYLFLSLISLIKGINHLDKGFALSYILWILLYISIVHMDINIKQKNRLFNSMIVSGLIFSILMIIKREYYYPYPSDLSRFTVIFYNGIKVDPNYLGASLVTPFIISIYRTVTEKKYLFVIPSILILIGVIMSGSRGAVFGIIIGSLLLILFNFNKKDILIAVTIVLLLFGAIYLKNYNFKIIINRLFMTKYLDTSNLNRMQFWKDSIKLLISHPGGIGFSEIKYYMYQGTAHNTFLEWGFHLGLIGISALTYQFYKIAKLSILRKDYLLFSIIMSNIFVSIFIPGQISTYFWFTLIMASLIYSSSIKIDE